jgi:hypothetical protein
MKYSNSDDDVEYFDAIDYDLKNLKLFNLYKNTIYKKDIYIKDSWSEPPASDFIIRGPNYPLNGSSNKKIFKEDSSESPYKTINVSMLNSENRIENSVVEINDAREFIKLESYNKKFDIPQFVIINFQLPSISLFKKTEHTLVQNIFQLDSKYINGSDSTLEKRIKRFVNSSQNERNKQFKYICQIVDGPNIAKKALNTLGVEKPVLIGSKLKTYYCTGPNYLEINIDVGSSVIARMIKGTAFEYVDKLVINHGFLFEGQLKEELPERLLFKASYNKTDLEKITHYINKNGDITDEKTW